MSGVTSANMMLFEVENRTYGNRAYCQCRDDNKFRFGAYGQDTVDRLKWMHSVWATTISNALKDMGGLDMRELMAVGLEMGDEIHNRHFATSARFTQILASHIAKVANKEEAIEVLQQLQQDRFATLNPIMAAAKSISDAFAKIPYCSLVSVMARNGRLFGVKVSGTGDRWFTAPAPVPVGMLLPGFTQDDVSPDMGDSTITETIGFGGMCLVTAPGFSSQVGGKVQMFADFTADMYKITIGESPHFKLPVLDNRGVPTGIDIFRVTETKITPVCDTGMANKIAGHGRVGTGITRPPLSIFEEAQKALLETSKQ